MFGLRIIGSSNFDANGQSLDGDRDGVAGGDALAIITKRGSTIGTTSVTSSAVLGALAVDELFASGQSDSILVAKPARRNRN